MTVLTTVEHEEQIRVELVAQNLTEGVCVCVAGSAVCVQSERQHRGVLVSEEGGTSCQQHLSAPITSR